MLDNVSPYRSEVSKLALIASTTQIQLRQTIAAHGIGSGTAHVLYGWTDDNLTSVASLTAETMGDPEARFIQTMNAALAMRRGWGCEQVTLVTDGYCASPGYQPETDLEDLFTSGDQQVSECMSLRHVDKWSTDVALIQMPYKVVIGPDVDFGTVASSRHDYDESPYTEWICKALDADVDPPGSRAPLIMHVMKLGIQLTGSSQ